MCKVFDLNVVPFMNADVRVVTFGFGDVSDFVRERDCFLEVLEDEVFLEF